MGSRENIDTVRRAIDSYVRRDMETMRALTAPDLELDWSRSKAWLAGVYRGFDEVMRFYEDYYAAFEEIAIDAERYIPAGDSVVVPNRARQQGREGIQVSAHATFVFTLRDARIRRICLYQDLADALADVGLDE